MLDSVSASVTAVVNAVPPLSISFSKVAAALVAPAPSPVIDTVRSIPDAPLCNRRLLVRSCTSVIATEQVWQSSCEVIAFSKAVWTAVVNVALVKPLTPRVNVATEVAGLGDGIGADSHIRSLLCVAGVASYCVVLQSVRLPHTVSEVVVALVTVN